MQHDMERNTSAVRYHVVRLRPGDDLRAGIEAAAQRHAIKAGAIVTCVGSLTFATLRLADGKSTAACSGGLEIVSLTGTLSKDGVHLHMAVADDTGRTMGGHVLQGCPVHTTAEIVLVVFEDLAFSREWDPATGYRELLL